MEQILALFLFAANGNQGSDEVIKLAGDGSASFLGVVTQKGLTLKPSDPSGGFYLIDKDNPGTYSATILEDGNASFAGTLEALGTYSSTADSRQFLVNTGGVYVKCKSDDTNSFTAFNVVKSSNNGSNATSIASIKGDGSASFVGSVAVGGDLAGVDGAKQGTFISTTGRVYATTSNGNLPVYETYLLNNGTPTSQIFGNGAASFAGSGTFGEGNITLSEDGSAFFAGRTDIGSNTLTDVALKLQSNHTSNSSTLYVQQHGAAGKSLFIGVNGSNTKVIDLRNDGSASFDGIGVFGSTSLTGSHALAATNNGNANQSTIVAVNVNSSTAPAVQVRNGTQVGDTTATINNDGSATFAGTIEAANLTDGTTTKTMTEVLAGAEADGSVKAVLRFKMSTSVTEYSKGISSVTDVGSGSLKINFETAFSGPDKYSVVGMGEAEYSFGVKGNDGQAADSVTLQHGRYGGPYNNTDKANIIVAS